MGLIWLLVVSESQQWKQTCSCCVGPACSFGSWWLVLICSMRKVLLAGVWFLGAHQQLDSSGSGGSVTSALHCTALHCTQRFPLGRVRRQIITHTQIRARLRTVRYGTKRRQCACCIAAASPLHTPPVRVRVRTDEESTCRPQAGRQRWHTVHTRTTPATPN
jgi:hypothetical protein